MKIVPFQECRSLSGWTPIQINSSTDPDTTYVVLVNPWGTAAESICDCRGYHFTGRCKHQTLALKRVCGWSELDNHGILQTDLQKKDQECPKCLGATRWNMEIADE